MSRLFSLFLDNFYFLFRHVYLYVVAIRESFYLRREQFDYLVARCMDIGRHWIIDKAVCISLSFCIKSDAGDDPERFRDARMPLASYCVVECSHTHLIWCNVQINGTCPYMRQSWYLFFKEYPLAHK